MWRRDTRKGNGCFGIVVTPLRRGRIYGSAHPSPCRVCYSPAVDDSPPRVGISSCLLGNPVRYDGGHKLERFLRDTLGTFVTWVPVCPEVEYGLPVPREALRLVGDAADPRLVGVRTGVDHTAAMKAWAARRLDELAGEDLCGFVFKSSSPSSGMRQVKVYPPGGGAPSAAGVGVFARAFMERFPHLPVEDEGRLCDPAIREGFIERLFVLAPKTSRRSST